MDHAKHIVDLLQHEQFDDVVKEFTPPLTEAFSAAQVRSLWVAMKQQVGSFTAILDQRLETPAPGFTDVTLGCQFERAVLNVTVEFDAQDKIVDLRFLRRPPPH
jgi:hypothetical protein